MAAPVGVPGPLIYAPAPPPAAGGEGEEDAEVSPELEELCDACHHGQLEIMSRLIEADKKLVYAIHPRYDAPLRVACCAGQVKAVEYLLDRGASVDYASAGGGTLLFWAGFHKQGDVARLLLARGADVNIPQESADDVVKVLLNYRGTKEQPNVWQDDALSKALWTTCCFGRTEVAHLLLKAGADFNRRNKRERLLYEVMQKKRPNDHAIIKLLEVCERQYFFHKMCERNYTIHKLRQLQDDQRCVDAALSRNPLSTSSRRKRKLQLGQYPVYLRRRLDRGQGLPVIEVRDPSTITTVTTVSSLACRPSFSPSPAAAAEVLEVGSDEVGRHHQQEQEERRPLRRSPRKHGGPRPFSLPTAVVAATRYLSTTFPAAAAARYVPTTSKPNNQSYLSTSNQTVTCSSLASSASSVASIVEGEVEGLMEAGEGEEATRKWRRKRSTNGEGKEEEEERGEVRKRRVKVKGEGREEEVKEIAGYVVGQWNDDLFKTLMDYMSV